MDSTKRRRRRRVEENDDAADRLSDLPDCLLHDVLSRLSPPQLVRTSVLSRRRRHLWRDLLGAILILDEREFSGDWTRFEDFADQALLSIPPEKDLDVFLLNLVSPSARGTYGPAFDISDRWIRRGLGRCPAAVDIRTVHDDTICWKPHCSYIAPPGPMPDMSAAGLCAAGFTRRMTTLRLVGVCLSASFLEDLGRYCPVLEDLHVERCWMDRLRLIVSPTLRSFVFLQPPRQHPLACTHLTIAAPCLDRLHLDLAYDGRGCQCVAAESATGAELLPPLAVAEASIRLTDTAYHGQPNVRARKKGKLDFIKSMHAFLSLLPNVVKLHLAGFNMTVLLEEESLEFPLLNSLKTLILQRCDLGAKFQTLTGILQNTPSLEKLGLHHLMFSDPPVKKRRGQQPSKCRISTPNIFWCAKLKTIEIKRWREDEIHLAIALSKIFERIHPEQRQHVNTVTIIV